MKKLEALIRARRKVANMYDAQLASIGWIKTPVTPSYNTHVFQSYIIQIPQRINRDQFINYLRQNGIEANFGTYALHKITFYKNKYRLRVLQFPITEHAFQTSVALPLFEHLSANQIQKIVGTIRKFQYKV